MESIEMIGIKFWKLNNQNNWLINLLENKVYSFMLIDIKKNIPLALFIYRYLLLFNMKSDQILPYIVLLW